MDKRSSDSILDNHCEEDIRVQTWKDSETQELLLHNLLINMASGSLRLGRVEDMRRVVLQASPNDPEPQPRPRPKPTPGHPKPIPSMPYEAAEGLIGGEMGGNVFP